VLCFCFVFYGCFDEVDKQRMRIENGALILGVKLCSDVPFQTGDFDNFHEVALGIFSHARHACPFVFFLIFVIEFVAMTMTLLPAGEFGSVEGREGRASEVGVSGWGRFWPMRSSFQRLRWKLP